MKAWERERIIMDEAIPKLLSGEEQTWLAANDVEAAIDNAAKSLWHSNVPGSYAPESIMTAAVQSMENMGYIVEDNERLIEEGLEAYGQDDMVALHKISAQLWHRVITAKKDPAAKYWHYGRYESWESYLGKVAFLDREPLDYSKDELQQKIYAGWIAQIIGGALGTAIEGYTTQNIEKYIGNVEKYVRVPNTYNDDITFEIAFLIAYEKRKSSITSEDVAMEWIGYVPMGWSAEDIALRNIRYGIFPPLSGSQGNPFSDWIGAQMRGAICGMLAPGNPKEAARLAWIDGQVSHNNNGIIGEVFNAMLVSLSFSNHSIRTVLDKVMSMLPVDSEYYEVVSFASRQCREHSDWRMAWKACEKRLEEYNWIHAYPNAAAEVVALYYGDGDFNRTMNIIAMCGQDVDCNAAQIMTAIGIIIGVDKIDSHWLDPIGDRLDTYLRNLKVMSIRELSQKTYMALEEDYK